ncbi:hypothetical protein RIF29_13661 [Crotalaria pallida]|uniref:Uncharacterized protein n=1 Tax=Crotalaria pallida TaxID=3830 RepID=A0AAN9IPL2_CROPI
MGNLSFVRFFVPLLLVVSFCFASSALATTTEVSGNESRLEQSLLKKKKSYMCFKAKGESCNRSIRKSYTATNKADSKTLTR